MKKQYYNFDYVVRTNYILLFLVIHWVLLETLLQAFSYSPKNNLFLSDSGLQVQATGSDPEIKSLNFVCVFVAVHSLLKSAFNTVAIEKEKIKQVLTEQEQTGQSNQILTLRRSLSQVCSTHRSLLLL